MALKDDAALLLRSKRYPRATALAVTGLEETGKGLILWLVGTGRVQETHRENVLQAIRRRHGMKQATAVALRVIGEVIPVARRIFRNVKFPKGTRKPQNWSDVASFLERMAPAIRHGALKTVDAASLSGDPKEANADVRRRNEGKLEIRRQRALYTDVNGTTVWSPSDIKRTEAAALVRDLRACLAALKPLADVADFGDDALDALLGVMEAQRQRGAGLPPRGDDVSPRPGGEGLS